MSDAVLLFIKISTLIVTLMLLSCGHNFFGFGVLVVNRVCYYYYESNREFPMFKKFLF